MLLLKNLVEQDEVAKTLLLKHWGFQNDDLDTLHFWRSSSNIIYKLTKDETDYFLRFAPTNEKSKKDMLGEIDLLFYLKSQDYPAITPLKTIRDSYLVEDLDYFAVLFPGSKGKELSDVDISPELMCEYGKSLGRFHELSLSFQTEKSSYRDILKTIKKTTKEPIILQEIDYLKKQMDSMNLPYGINHFDFEPDNVFYQKHFGFEIIDFDDSIYTYYVHDLITMLDSVKDEYNCSPETYENYKEQILKGYFEAFTKAYYNPDIEDVFIRFNNLYKYHRMTHCLSVKPKENIEIFQPLIEKLEQRISIYLKQLESNKH